MGQEFFINDQKLENKIRELLPSQGGKGAGFDLSASTQIVPIVDLTESAEGSNVRQDLQTAFSFDNATAFSVANTTTDVITNTGYYRVTGVANLQTSTTADTQVQIYLSDGVSDKTIKEFFTRATSSILRFKEQFDFTVFIDAGQVLKIKASNLNDTIGATRQIATIDGELV